MGTRKSDFSVALLEWYGGNKRDLPWRRTKDPYKIWLSEIILQQTRVSQGLPYYLRFVAKYPSVAVLANAPEREVLRLWQGLGYYSRARNLHRCSKIISKDFGGKFPGKFEALKKLPGIGDYTAAAIASLAFGQPVAVVDGNVFRVLARVFGIDLNIASPAGKKYFFELANSLIPADQPGEFNQAVMEFGAVDCTPRNPKCEGCIFIKQCVAYRNESQSLLPVKSKLKQRKIRHFNYFVIRWGKKIWMKARSGKDIWEGLNEFFLMESKRQVSDSNSFQLFVKETGIQPEGTMTKSTRIRQVLSHQEIVAKFFDVRVTKTDWPILKNGKFRTANEIEKLAKPVLISRYLQQIGQ
jgi:A/G-specific adenine glycosylase